MNVIATDPLSLLFIACFLFGLLFMVVAALLGHVGDHDIGHSLHHVHFGASHGHATTGGGQSGHGTGNGHGSSFSVLSVLNPTSVVLFLLGFGFFGYFFHNTTNLALPFTMVLALIGGVMVAAAILVLLSRLFGNVEGNTIQDVSDRVGLVGKVSISIQENGVGEILYTSPAGMRKSIPARSSDGRRLERDQEVVVLDYQKGIAEVDTWEHFMNQEEASTLHPVSDLDALRSLLENSEKEDAQYIMRKDLQKE